MTIRKANPYTLPFPLSLSSLSCHVMPYYVCMLLIITILSATTEYVLLTTKGVMWLTMDVPGKGNGRRDKDTTSHGQRFPSPPDNSLWSVAREILQ